MNKLNVLALRAVEEMDSYIPNNKGVVVLATERCEVFLVVREGEALNEHLMELEALNDLKGVEVPNNDVSLKY